MMIYKNNKTKSIIRCISIKTINPLHQLLLRLKKNNRGQSTVESAIVLPIMVFLIVGTIQLVMVQHAKVMVEYAAFNAARAGVVWNGDKEQMTNAALISLMPTFARTDNIGDLLATWARLKVITEATNAVDKGVAKLEELVSLLPNVNVVGRLPDVSVIEIDILEPKRGNFNAGDELAFDDPSNRKNTRLTIKLRYLYWMKIPFANWVIHTAWIAQRRGIRLVNSIHMPEVQIGGTTLKGSARENYIDMQVASSALTGNQIDAELGIYRLLARAFDIYVIPLEATYTMRMQSDLYKENVTN